MSSRCVVILLVLTAAACGHAATASASSIVPGFKVSAMTESTSFGGHPAIRVRSITISGASIGRFVAIARCDRRTCKREAGRGKYRRRRSRGKVVFSNVNWVLTRRDSVTVALNRRGWIGRYVTLAKRTSESTELVTKKSGCVKRDFQRRRCPRGVTSAPVGTPVAACRPGYDAYANAGGNVLAGGTELTGNACIASPNQKFVLRLKADGDLSLLGPDDYLLWSAQAGAIGPSRLTLDAFGVLRLVKSDGVIPFSVGEATGLGADLAVQDDGNLVLKRRDGSVSWQTGTVGYNGNTHRLTYGMNPGQILRGGEFIRSGDMRFHLILQGDGNLVLYGTSGPAVWNSGTVGSGAAFLGMQGDGNLVLYTAANVAVWSTGTNGHPGSHLGVQNDGNIVVYNTAGQAVWSR